MIFKETIYPFSLDAASYHQGHASGTEIVYHLALDAACADTILEELV